MTEYRRTKVKGASYFFTVNCAERHGNRLLVNHIDLLRQVFRKVKKGHPFKINAMVVLPDHMHYSLILYHFERVILRYSFEKWELRFLVFRGQRTGTSQKRSFLMLSR